MSTTVISPRQLTATLVVCASDAKETWRASWSDSLGRYLICDGTSDQVEINAAFVALPVGGGSVYLTEGTFTLSGSIAWAISNTALIMNSGTYLFMSNGSNATPVLVGNVAGPTIENVLITGGRVDGNRAGNAGANVECINFQYVDNSRVTNVSVYNSVDDGIDLDYSVGNVIENIYATNCNGSGVHVSTGSLRTTVNNIVSSANGQDATRDANVGRGAVDLYISTTGSTVSNVKSYQDRNGVLIRTNGVTLNNITVIEPIKNAIRFSTDDPATGPVGDFDLWGINIANIVVDMNSVNFDAVYAVPDAGRVIEGVTITDVKVRNIASGYAAVNIGCRRSLVSGVWVHGASTGYGVYETDPGGGSAYGNNTVIGTSPLGINLDTLVVLSSATSRMKDSLFRETENSGTATITAAAVAVVVNHGVAFTPTIVQITPTEWGNATKAWVTAIGASQFTINVDAVPGVATAIFNWYAAVSD